LYSKPKIYNKLSDNNNSNNVLLLFQYAVMFNKPDFMVKLYLFFTQGPVNMHEGLNLIFNPEVITNILLHDDPNLYKTAIELINYTDENFVKETLIDYANQRFNEQEKENSGTAILEYLKSYKLNITQDYKTLFEKLGQHTIDNIILPYSDTAIRLIIICHGITLDDTKIQIEFPFNKLCFFVEKSEKLQNQCIVSRSINELICAGNYDNNLKCEESRNNTIIVDNMRFKFENKTLLDKNNKTSGIYICENRKVNKINVLGIDDTTLYTFEELIGICNLICKQSNIQPNNVNLLFFACRGNTTTKVIAPEPVITPTEKKNETNI